MNVSNHKALNVIIHASINLIQALQKNDNSLCWSRIRGFVVTGLRGSIKSAILLEGDFQKILILGHIQKKLDGLELKWPKVRYCTYFKEVLNPSIENPCKSPK